MGRQKRERRAARKRRQMQREAMKDRAVEAMMLELPNEETFMIAERPAFMGELHIGVAQVYSDYKVRIILRDDLDPEQRAEVEEYIAKSGDDFSIAEEE